MTAEQIRQSFLDFFKEKQHTIVPSASLLPQSPGLLFTNAGMNPFVPYFLGVESAPYNPPRATDTQKCIRAGGKHNDLEDVGYDTYHHTFFEMLGNWSFGDYFKKEAIAWAWELIVERWGLPANRLYASVYAPKEGDPGEFDQTAWEIWAKLFESKGCDPHVHIVHGNVKDNFWMMGETGPCGPCSELHVDLTPHADSKGKLVNNDSDLCIEIWNLVFIQYNAEADGSFRELPSKHIDTGMGFERICSIMQGTNGFQDFSRKPSNYNTDVFLPIFDKISELSGKGYEDIYPLLGEDKSQFSETMKTAIAFRVIADHLRTLSFSIADGILPGNNGRNYVLRRILRRAVRYGRTLGFSGEKPFFGALVNTLVEQMGAVFPELKNRQEVIQKTLEHEESSFNQTLDRGLKRFEDALKTMDENNMMFKGEDAFELYDTFGFPVDLTALIAAERGITVDMAHFEELMEQQRERARAAGKTTIVRALDIASDIETKFHGFEHDSTEAQVQEVIAKNDYLYVITDQTVFYAEMGGQAGDLGTLTTSKGHVYPVLGVQQVGKARAHILEARAEISPHDTVTLSIDDARRRQIEAHHTATHLLHWALHEIVSKEASQQGSSVDEHRLRFDFNSSSVTPAQIQAIEAKINAVIDQKQPVSWQEVPYKEVKENQSIIQFFGDKYGDLVRVVQIGGEHGKQDGFSMELCGGTHVRCTSELKPFVIKNESAIASGVRRIEALCAQAAIHWQQESLEKELVEKQQLLEKWKVLHDQLSSLIECKAKAPTIDHDLVCIKEAIIDIEKLLKKTQQAQAAAQADALLQEKMASESVIIECVEGNASLLQEMQNSLKKAHFPGSACLIIDDGEKLHIAVHCGSVAQAKQLQAGVILSEINAVCEGKGGGKADQARGATLQRHAITQIQALAQQLLA